MDRKSFKFQTRLRKNLEQNMKFYEAKKEPHHYDGVYQYFMGHPLALITSSILFLI